MRQPISSIRNLGPKTDAHFRAIGIDSADQLRAIGAFEGYRKLLENGMRPHFIGFYCIYLGLQNRPWNDMDAAEKSALRIEFDALVAEVRAQHPGRLELEQALNRLGVLPAPK